MNDRNKRDKRTIFLVSRLISEAELWTSQKKKKEEKRKKKKKKKKKTNPFPAGESARSSLEIAFKKFQRNCSTSNGIVNLQQNDKRSNPNLTSKLTATQIRAMRHQSNVL